MTESDAVKIIRSFIERTKFPKTCSSCGRRFNTFEEYLRNTIPRGDPVSYDAESGRWTPWSPIGTIALANCSCGTTLTISSKGMSLLTIWRLMRWARRETQRRGVHTREILARIREEIHKQILGADSDSRSERTNAPDFAPRFPADGST